MNTLNKHELKTAVVKGGCGLIRQETKCLVMSLGSRLRQSLAVNDLQPSIINDDVIHVCLSDYF